MGSTLNVTMIGVWYFYDLRGECGVKKELWYREKRREERNKVGIRKELHSI